ncbi:MAG: S1 family peptidase [candidate division KSB1 bacterium]|nr:S1 family peptidase [candidate division KSB1 bacterium]MDZ7391846.1 S1 family peptidase [candidate division KSB1 bacterium]MDZ7412300.1 S1 family peptidase [candidate division KSB1 bacterium]
MVTHDEVRRVKAKHEKALLRKKNVVGVGIGYKEVGGRKTEQLSLVVLVEKKLPEAELAPKDLVDKELDGVVTDVKEVGKIVAQKARTERWRPAPPGVSIGHYAITAGTFGAVVADATTGEKLILSNNHVLANCNGARPGDAILQPGPADGGQAPQDRIGELLRFVPIAFEGGNGGDGGCRIARAVTGLLNLLAAALGSAQRVIAFRTAATNQVDAAVARPLSLDAVSEEILEVGLVSGSRQPELGMAVAKSGRTTGVTTGLIEVVEATTQVSYGGGRTATFVGQVLTGNMSSPGDSGSLLVEAGTNLAVGLLFAGSDQVTVYNPISAVMSELGVSFG